MDATYGTNNMGADLFAVLAEVDGTGVPLAYCFVDVFKENKKGKRNAEPGTIVDVLIHFLQALKCYHLNPTFFGIDKDSAEIFAVSHVWPGATIQLCYWHARKAITAKLKSSDQTKTQDGYWPSEAQALIPELEICWGSIATRRPNGLQLSFARNDIFPRRADGTYTRRGAGHSAPNVFTSFPFPYVYTRPKWDPQDVKTIASRFCHRNVHLVQIP